MAQDKHGPSWRDSGGFNLISVLMGMALSSLVVFLASRAMVASKKAKNSVRAGERYQQVLVVLQDSLKDFIKTAIVSTTVPCANAGAYFDPHAFLRLYAGGLQATQTAIPADVDAQVWAKVFQQQLAVGSFAGASLNRCPNTVQGTNGRFHFCLKVQRDTSQPKESLLHAPLVFAEVSIQLNDLGSGAPLTCAEYLDPVRTSAGATVDYVLFWLFENGTQLDLKKRSGSFYVNK